MPNGCTASPPPNLRFSPESEVTDWTVRVDRLACLGCGVCLDYAPRSFVQDEDGQAVLREPPGDELDRIREAVGACPTGALELVIGGTNAE